MTNRRRGPRFALKTRDGLAVLKIFVAENVGSHSFDGDLARHEVLVASEVNLAHRAATEPFFQQVARGQQTRTRQCDLRVCLVLWTQLNGVFVADFATGALAHGFLS